MDVAIYIALIAAVPPALGWLISARKHRAEARSEDVDAQQTIIKNLLDHNGWLKEQLAPGMNGLTLRQELDGLSLSVADLTGLVQKCVDDHDELRATVGRIEAQTKGK